ncbi:hypothetical protein ACTQ34_03825 [Agathobaculum sp. LCP25S3_E8]|uniref:hypothetical protein n=1 Tax=Agathobaculum sp. LCP25S3_E8 TaxID=3438735 RepID=UPI003F90EC84
MDKKRKWRWWMPALVLTVVLPVCALIAPSVMKSVFWQFASDPAVAVLQGEHVGGLIRAALLTAAPVVPVVCFILEQAGVRRARWQRKNSRPPEFATQEERKAFYLKELDREKHARQGTPWIVYAALCGLSILLFGSGVLRAALPRQIEETARDLEAYRAGQPAVYEGPLQLVDRQLRDGVRVVPDERFVYYDSAEDSLRCAVTLLSQTQLMQESYTVTYLPETGTILTITDAAGNLRTGGAEAELSAPTGCWLYGDLAVPICNKVEGYAGLSKEQQALFDLMYSEVLSGGVAAGKIPTRSFDLPYPLKKDEFNAVLELYEASVSTDKYPNHGYRTDDGRIVRQAYCYGITYAK